MNHLHDWVNEKATLCGGILPYPSRDRMTTEEVGVCSHGHKNANPYSREKVKDCDSGRGLSARYPHNQ